MKFIPFPDKIVVKPLEQKTVIVTQKEQLLEKGIVVSVGDNVRFVQPGDTVYFDSWGCYSITDSESNTLYVVSSNSQVILGKET